MGDFKKGEIAAAAKTAAAKAIKIVIAPITPHATPNGVVVQTNVASVQRFPLPLTIGSAVVLAVGAIAFMRGHRVFGGLAGVLGVAGIGAAAAAPEINAAMSKVGAPNLPGLV